MHCASIVLDVVKRSQYAQDLDVLCLLDQWARKNTVYLLVEILTSRYQSVVDDRMKIKRTSCVVNMLEESTLNYHIVL